MPKKIVIIGAVALGPKAACRARRMDPTAQVTLIEQGRHLSYGGCGIPFFVSGDISDIQALMSTSFHMVRDEKFFKEAKGVQVRSQTRAVAIDRQHRLVRIHNSLNGKEDELSYDHLVLATGASPFKPDIAGIDLKGVTTISNPTEALLIKESLSRGRVNHCVIINKAVAGYKIKSVIICLTGFCIEY